MSRTRSPRIVGRRPNCPKLAANVRARWTPTEGWRFRADVMVEGSRVYGAWRTTVADAAQDAEGMRKRGKAVETVAEVVTLGEAMQRMLEVGETRGFRKKVKPCRAATLQHYRECLAPAWRFFDNGERPLHEITKESLAAYCAARLAEKALRCKCAAKGLECAHEPVQVTPQRVNKELLALSIVFATALRQGRLPAGMSNPVDAVDRFADAEKDATPTYTVEDVARIVQHLRDAKPRWEKQPMPSRDLVVDLVLLLFLSGMRIGEAAHLTRRNVDLARGVLTVPKEGKTGSRELPLSTPLRTLLDKMLKGKAADDPLLPGETPEQRAHNVKRNLFPRWRKHVPEGLRGAFHAHTFRAAFRTHLENELAPEGRIHLLGGWSKSRSVSLGYSRPTLLQLRATMTKAFDPYGRKLLKTRPTRSRTAKRKPA